jgi:hypothetical protein
MRDLMGAKTERLILAFSFGGVSLRALHQARVCISRVVSYRKHHLDFSCVYPPSRRVALARRAALAREPRAGEQSGRGSTAQRAIPPPLLDLGHRPVGCGTRRHLRRHAVVRRESPRCQTSCAPDGHALGGGGAQGCASARGLRRGFGGFTGGLRAARLMAGPAVAAGGRHETSVERLAPSLAGEWDRVGRTSRVACIVCVWRSCGTSLYLCKHLVSSRCNRRRV